MATGSLYGSVSESTGLYGIGAASGGTYFEWFIFQDSLTAPATPTGGSWSFSTNIGTPPTGWVVSPPPAPVNQIWVSIAVVDTRSPNTFTWSVPGLMASSGLPILSASGVPSAGTGLNGQLYINTATTPQGLYFKQSGAWTQLTGSNFVDLINNQTIGGVKTFSQTIQGNISGTASNVTGTVAVANGGTGATTAGDARTNLGLGTIATQDAGAVAITGGSITGITDLAIADGGTGASTADQARTNLGAVGLSDTQTLTNKTINAANNTLSNIPNSALSNSSVTINGTLVSLGTAIAVTAETPNELIFSTGLSATSNFDGSQETIVSVQTVGTAGVYGSAGTTPQITVNTVGQVTNITPLNTVITTNNISGSVAIAQGGTGASSAKFAMQNLLPDYANNAGKALVLTASGTDLEWKSTVGVGTVTSVDGSGGATGLTLTGGPITAAGTLTLGGTLAIDSGGTGAVNAPDARTNLGLGSAAVLDAGVALGVATLDGGGTVPTSQLPAAVLGAVKYQGTWNATTNTPTLASSVGEQGHYYVVNVAGSTDLNGITDWKIGDWAIYNGSIWEKIDNTDAVTSVNGYTGTVVLTNTDISGFGTMSTQNANAVAITGGSINGTTIGATTPSTVTGTTVTATTLVVNDNSTLGSSNSDRVTFTARVNSDIDPATDNTYDLGRNSHAWRNLYLTGTANLAALTASGTVTLNSLTASTALALNASKQVVSVTNTGTGNNVLATSPTLVAPNLGTPASGVVTNLTGTASININGTVGATTPNTGNFTVLTENGSPAVVQTDIGTAPNEIPLNQYLGNLAYQDAANIAGPVGVGGALTLNAGTANGVAYLNGSKVLTTGSALTFDGNELYIAGVSTRAEIRLGSTGYIKGGSNVGDTRILADRFRLYDLAGTQLSYNLASTGEQTWYVGGSEKMRLTSTGLGIGTSSPAVKLDVARGSEGEYLRVGGDNAANARALRFTSSTGGASNGALHTINAASAEGAIALATAGTERLRITSAGNVGIGTSSPGAKLQVAWSLDQLKFTNPSPGFKQIGASYTGYVSGNDYAAIILGTDGSSGGKIQFSVTPSAGSLTTAATLDQNGNLGLGVTPSAWGSTYKAFDLNTFGSVAATTGGMRVMGNAFFTGSAWAYKTTAEASRYDQAGGIHSWYTAPSGTAGNTITFTQAATLTANGEYLVGLTSATGVAKLQVSGAIRTTGFTVATLPAGTVGMRTYVTDALAPSFGVTVSGGGAVTIPVFYDGANWIVA